jgi:hypothetical protein
VAAVERQAAEHTVVIAGRFASINLAANLAAGEFTGNRFQMFPALSFSFGNQRIEMAGFIAPDMGADGGNLDHLQKFHRQLQLGGQDAREWNYFIRSYRSIQRNQ